MTEPAYQAASLEVTAKVQLTVFDETERLERDGELPCRVHDPELFFAETPQDVELAKSLCTTCPVREACLAGALERREPWGVWGGELFVHGVVVPRKRPRGRPRKNEVVAA
jgi:WhiB family transcriptional regulator, redox-sensing transcriptional regulator